MSEDEKIQFENNISEFLADNIEITFKKLCKDETLNIGNDKQKKELAKKIFDEYNLAKIYY